MILSVYVTSVDSYDDKTVFNDYDGRQFVAIKIRTVYLPTLVVLETTAESLG